MHIVFCGIRMLTLARLQMTEKTRVIRPVFRMWPRTFQRVYSSTDIPFVELEASQ